MNLRVHLELFIFPTLFVIGCTATDSIGSKGKRATHPETFVVQEQQTHQPPSLLEGENTEVRIRAIVELGNSKSDGWEAVPRLISLLDDNDARVRVQVVKTLERVGNQSTNAVMALTKALTDKEWLVRMQSASALGTIGMEREEALAALIKALSDENEGVRMAAVKALGPIGPAAAQTINNRKIYIIGKNHRYDDAASDVLSELALQGNIVLGNEGTVRNSHFESELAKLEYGNRPGIIYGIENELALKYSVYLLGYGALTRSSLGRSYMLEQVFAVIKYQKQKLMTNDWAWLGKTELTGDERSFYDQVNEFIGTNKDKDSLVFGELLKESKLDEGRTAEWRSLLRRLIVKLTDQIDALPSESRPNVEKVREFIDRPADDELFDQIFDEVNIKWRDGFIIRNAQEVIAIAIEKDLPVYIHIGSRHVLDLAQRFGATYRGMSIRSYYNSTPALLKQIKQEAAGFEEYRRSKSNQKTHPD